MLNVNLNSVKKRTSAALNRFKSLQTELVAINKVITDKVTKNKAQIALMQSDNEEFSTILTANENISGNIDIIVSGKKLAVEPEKVIADMPIIGDDKDKDPK